MWRLEDSPPRFPLQILSVPALRREPAVGFPLQSLARNANRGYIGASTTDRETDKAQECPHIV